MNSLENFLILTSIESLNRHSDHDLILTTVKIKGTVHNEEIFKKRNFSRFNETDYITELLGQRWSKVYDILDPTLIDSAITDLITNVLNKHAPIKTFKGGGGSRKGKINLSQECKQRIRNRNLLRKAAKVSGSEDDWERWRKEKNLVNNLLRKESKNNSNIEQIAVEKDITTKQLWQRVKKMAGWINSLLPTKFTTDDIII